MPLFYVLQHIFEFCGRRICTFRKIVVPLHPKSESNKFDPSSGESGESNAGVRLSRNHPDVNTYRKRAEEKSDTFPISGAALFVFFRSMKPTYIQLWELVFHICERVKSLIRNAFTY